MKLIFIVLPQIYFLKFRIYCRKLTTTIMKFARSVTRLPNITLPTLPTIKIPQIHLPKISFPKFHMPRITLPALKLPRIPAYTRPSLSPPHIINGAIAFACFYLLVGIAGNVSASGSNPFKLAQNESADSASAEEPIYPESLNALAPASGYNDEDATAKDGRYAIEQSILDIETVLIPRENTVISSSRDSKIKAIYFDNGQHFKKGDVLIEYTCDDARAEVKIARIQQDLSSKKSDISHKLFKLDIISDLEKYELETENKQASARIDLYESRMSECLIRAEYDGRVIKRLANAGEFTRTDRVLMEIASLDYLKAEFLMPSKWLRWVNIDAPITINIGETDKTYNATIKYIYGEVDPVSESIQMTAQLEPYEDPLLPGMSGYAKIDLNAIREAGVRGFLEKISHNDEP